jgi:bifunctional non-homologous end joining protein LigD
MGLRTYRAKRRFDVTPEPRGATESKRPAKSALRFVVHKHRASHLHYDLRLESGGVLHSWAVPKGPALDPAVKRLAMAVEDHPIEYATFEGTIPENEYGGGTMMVWDRGTWQPDEPNVERSIAKGELKFSLHGEKLRGSWVLVRTAGRGGGTRDERSWLLIKHRDEAASDEDVADARPYSVASGRLLAQIAHDEGGDVAKAASGDPPAAVERLIAELGAVKSKAAPAARTAGRKPAARKPATQRTPVKKLAAQPSRAARPTKSASRAGQAGKKQATPASRTRTTS